MANFGGLILTQRGVNLLAKALTGVTLNFTRVGVGSGIWGETPPDELLDLVDEKASLAIQSLVVTGDGTSRLRAVLTNGGLETGYWLREVGIFATDPDLGEILYAASSAGDQPDFIPAAGAIAVEEVFNLYTVVGNAQQVTAVINSSTVLVTTADLEEHNQDTDAHPGLIDEHNQDPDAHGAILAALAAHMQDPDAHTALWDAIAALAGISPGDIIASGRATPNAGYLACNGAAVSRTAYHSLFAAVGTAFGGGDGATTFNVPNIPAGYALTQAGGDLGASTAGQNKEHTHSVSAMSNSCSGQEAGPCGYPGYHSYTTATTSGTDSAGGAANLAAGLRINFYIKY